MKNIKNITWLLIVALAPLFASCSWEKLPAYDNANIDGVAFYYRYADPTAKDPITGEPIIRNGSLTTQNVNIDSNAGTITLALYANPNNFPATVLSGISLNNVVGTVTLPTAARIAPVGNNKVLGVPDDWTSPHQFVVTAGDGTKKNWTITVTGLTK